MKYNVLLILVRVRVRVRLRIRVRYKYKNATMCSRSLNEFEKSSGDSL